MLHFHGGAFAQHTFLRIAYRPFLERKEDACAFLSLNLLGADYSFSQEMCCTESTVISTTTLVYSPDLSFCKISSYGYCCIAQENFEQVFIPFSYLRKLSKQGFIILNEALYQLARFRALFLNMLVLHASAVVYQDEVVLFSGMKGAGKSTQARLWLKNTDAWVLNYDKPVVKLDEERVLVSGSPWGGKEDLSINEVRPAKALFFVHQAKENRVVRLSAAKAYSQAYLNYFVYPLSKDIEQRYDDALNQLVRKVPIYDLYCTDTKEAVEVVKKELYGE